MAGKRRAPAGPPLQQGGFLRSIDIDRSGVEEPDRFPFNIPAVAKTRTLTFHPKVTFFVGENGSGKSTLLEAIAMAAGFNAEGGTKNFRFSTRRTESELVRHVRLTRGAEREQDGFFLRAESFFNVASQIDEIGMKGAYGGTSLHEQSHGESFLALVEHRFGRDSLFLMDEPEAALSPQRQLALLAFMDGLVQHMRGQMVIATHSPILLAYPDAKIYAFGEHGIAEQAYEETEHFLITRDFLNNRERFFKTLFALPEE